MYLLAGREIPDVKYYGDLDQIGNGVGLLADFKADFIEKIKEVKEDNLSTDKAIAMITGKSFYPLLNEYAKILMESIKGLKIKVFAIENKFFGKNITVAGLVVGEDIISQVKDKLDGIDYVMIPRTMLREFETVMLDGTSIEDLSKGLSRPILITEPTGSGIIEEVRSVL